MMKLEHDKNCKITQDLMPSYVENLLSNESKNFVDEHISNCNNCKKYLDTISQNLFKEKEKEIKTNKLEIDSLKKYRKKMSILKITLLSILVLIIIILIAIFSRYKYNENIFHSIAKKYEEIQLLDNFHITRKTIYIDYINNFNDENIYDIYYKDGKYKRESNWYTMYGNINSTDYLEIFHETKTIEYTNSNHIPYTKKDLVRLCVDYSYDIVYMPIFEKLYFLNLINMQQIKYNGKDCYVIKSSSDESYREYWIDKESNTMVRRVEELYGQYYREEIFTLTTNQTQNEDVEIDNIERYSDYTQKSVSTTHPDILQEIRDNHR